jgi:hypothetical protein
MLCQYWKRIVKLKCNYRINHVKDVLFLNSGNSVGKVNIFQLSKYSGLLECDIASHWEDLNPQQHHCENQNLECKYL